MDLKVELTYHFTFTARELRLISKALAERSTMTTEEKEAAVMLQTAIMQAKVKQMDQYAADIEKLRRNLETDRD